jgi:hypothetical protein
VAFRSYLSCSCSLLANEGAYEFAITHYQDMPAHRQPDG